MASRRLLLSVASSSSRRISLPAGRYWKRATSNNNNKFLRGIPSCCSQRLNTKNTSFSCRFFSSGDKKGGGKRDDRDDKKEQDDDDLDEEISLADAQDLLNPSGDQQLLSSSSSTIIKATPPTTTVVDDEDDPFGVNFDDGADRLGPVKDLPPIYKRDSATGRLTGDIQQELTEEEKRLLKADPIEQDKVILKRIDKYWEKSGSDESGLPSEIDKLGERIRRSDMGLNVLGRSVQAQAAKEKLDDGSELGRDETGFSQPLTPSEYKAFSEFMEKKHKTKVRKEDIPVQDDSGRKRRDLQKDNELGDPDSVDLSLKWLTARAQRQMDDLLDDDPYSDLMPGDLSPTRLVNRKRAKPIPTKLLHHNNIGLLKRFVTPTGQIMNRVQSRLGARDQRRIAKLVKRARALGLVPYVGQFKAEQHGWIHAPDIHEDREWEKELGRRGLVVKRNTESSKPNSGSDE